jgi:DNA-binding GntR family transcriptional regulator
MSVRTRSRKDDAGRAHRRNGQKAGTSVTAFAYNVLLDRILNRSLPAGTALRERSLAEAVGISRTPLREALSRLEGEGLIVRKADRSVEVRAITVREYIDALHVRRLLESEAASLAAMRMSAEEILDLKSQVECLMKDSNPSPSHHWSVDDNIHLAIARATDNDLMMEIIGNLRHKTRIFNLKRMPDRFMPGCREHLILLDALLARDADAARAAMTTHIDNVKSSILAKLAEA